MERAQLLSEALSLGKRYTRFGKTAQYIPELAFKDPSRLGIALCELDGTILGAGDWTDNFAVQSISKVMALILAIEQNGMEYVFEKVGMEPTGDAFNSMVRLDQLTNNKPFNPMINAGAIAVASCIRGRDLEARKKQVWSLRACLPEIHPWDLTSGYLNQSERPGIVTERLSIL